MQTFREELPQRLHALHHALAQGNREDVAHQLHTLKGMSANVGATGIHAITIDMQAAMNQGDISDLAGKMEKLEVTCKQIEKVLLP
nr:Hpt domain-containing protein [Desulfurispira natronophila]